MSMWFSIIPQYHSYKEAQSSYSVNDHLLPLRYLTLNTCGNSLVINKIPVLMWKNVLFLLLPHRMDVFRGLVKLNRQRVR